MKGLTTLLMTAWVYITPAVTVNVEAEKSDVENEKVRNMIFLTDVGVQTTQQVSMDVNNVCLLSQEELDIIATTLIGEVGAINDKEAIAVLCVIRNRAEKNGTSYVEEILKPKQFSMWNPRCKGVSTQSLINKFKNSKNWGQDNWDRAYRLSRKIHKMEDVTDGAIGYYAHKVCKPYWSSSTRGWRTTLKTDLHTFGLIE